MDEFKYKDRNYLISGSFNTKENLIKLRARRAPLFYLMEDI